MFKLFDKNKEPKDINDVLKYLETLESKIESLNNELKTLKSQSKFSVQKVEIMRYNPFSNAGGNQSFSIVLLDANNDGIMITSLFSQDGNRVYSKPIKDSKSEFELSKEEKEVIKRATS